MKLRDVSKPEYWFATAFVPQFKYTNLPKVTITPRLSKDGVTFSGQLTAVSATMVTEVGGSTGSITSKNGGETRPVNYAVRWIIKVK